jgi:hypothetical protein
MFFYALSLEDPALASGLGEVCQLGKHVRNDLMVLFH